MPSRCRAPPGTRSLAFLAFCALASGLYVVNDWVDRAQDRLHPDKKLRPIAAGEVGGVGAAVLVVVCWLVGGVLAVLAGPEVWQPALAYVVVELAYSFWLKRYVVVDVLVIATGFVLRVVGGAAAINVPVSNWLFLCALLLALFLALGKRRAELVSLEASQAHGHRLTLADYSVPLLDQMLTLVAGTCVVAYALYTVAPDTVEKVGSDRMKFTVPFVVYGILRYLYLLHRRGRVVRPSGCCSRTGRRCSTSRFTSQRLGGRSARARLASGPPDAH